MALRESDRTVRRRLSEADGRGLTQNGRMEEGTISETRTFEETFIVADFQCILELLTARKMEQEVHDNHAGVTSGKSATWYAWTARILRKAQSERFRKAGRILAVQEGDTCALKHGLRLARTQIRRPLLRCGQKAA